MRRVAVVHDWLVSYAGSERVLEQILSCYPEADVFSLIDCLSGEERAFLNGRKVQTSFLQSLPLKRRLYQKCLPLMPAAIEHLDLRDYSLILTSSSAISKGILTTPEQLHVCYLQSRSLRYGYDERFFYAARGLLGPVQEMIMSRARVWDYVASHRPDHTIANSEFVRRWHQHRYGIESTVIYPPVDLALFGGELRDAKADYYVLVSRFEKYKQVPLVIEAFNQLGLPLVIIGGGSQEKAIRRMAKPNIRSLGVLPPREVAKVVADARASIYAGREDFGIALVEAQAAGTPVIAFSDGAAKEIVRGLTDPSPTGVLFGAQTVEAVKEGVKEFEKNRARIQGSACSENSLRFSRNRFRKEFKAFVEDRWAQFAAEMPKRT